MSSAATATRAIRPPGQELQHERNAAELAVNVIRLTNCDAISGAESNPEAEPLPNDVEHRTAS